MPEKVREQFGERLEIFIKDPQNSVLKVHTLKGNLTGRRAFSITGDYRVIYRIVGDDTVKLLDIGRHGQVY